MPSFHHAVAGAFAGHRQAVLLARQAYCKVANINHLLHLAQAFGQNLAGFQRHQLTECRLGGAKLFAQQAYQLPTGRGWHKAPLKKGCMRLGNFEGDGCRAVGRQLCQQRAVNRRLHAQAAAMKAAGIHAQRLQKAG